MRLIFLRFDITDNPRFNKADQAYIGLYVNHAEKMGDAFREVSVYGMTDDGLDNWDETMLTFILLVEEPNGGDEVRFDSKEDTDTIRAPILHTVEPVVHVESKSLSGVTMQQNFPNPFSSTTTLSYNLKEAELVSFPIKFLA